MSEDEQARIRGKLIGEHQAVRSQLASIRSKARMMVEQISLATDLLSGKTTGHMAKGQLCVHVTPNNALKVKGVEWPTLEQVGEIVDQRNAATQRLADLEAEMRSHRMGDYLPK